MMNSKLIGLILSLAVPLMASATNNVFVVDGRAEDASGNGVTETVTVSLEIKSPLPSSCLLWAESQTVSAVNGDFQVEVGNAVNRSAGTAGGVAADFRSVFINNPGLSFTGATCASGTSYSPGADDARSLVMSVNSPSLGVLPLNPIKLAAVPYALQAQEVGGYGINNLFKISGTGSPSVIFAPAEVSSLKSFSGTSAAGQFPVSSGAPNQVLGMNAAGDGMEYKSITAGSNVTINHTAGGLEISATGGGGGGSVNSVSAGGLPLSTGGTSTDPIISIAQAGSGQSGYLSAADWVNFNSKQPAGSYLTDLTGGDVTATGPGSAVATISPNAVTTAKLADSSVTSAKVVDASLAPVDLDFAGTMAVNTGLVVRNGSQFHNQVCASNQVLVWTVANGWVCNAVVLSETDPKIGAQTANMVSKWDGSTMISSGIFESGGNVGIGTAAPMDKLHVTSGGVRADYLHSGFHKIVDSDQSNYVSLEAGGDMVSNYSIRFPVSQGAAGQILRLQDATGLLAWASPNVQMSEVKGLVTSAPMNLYVNAGSTGVDCDGSSSALETAAGVQACAVSSLSSALAKVPSIVRHSVTINIQSNLNPPNSVVIESIIQAGGSIVILGGGNTVNFSANASSPAIINFSRGFDMGAPAVRIESLTITGHPSQASVMNMGNLSLKNVTINGGMRGISAEDAYTQIWGNASLISAAATNNSSAIEISRGTLELGAGAGSPNDGLTVTVYDPGTSNFGTGISCSGCSIRHQSYATTNISLPASGSGQVVGLRLSRAELSIQGTSTSEGLSINGNGGNWKLVEAQASFINVYSGKFYATGTLNWPLSLSEGSVLKTMGPSELQIISDGMTAARLIDGSKIEIQGQAAFDAYQSGSNNQALDLQSGSQFRFNPMAAKSLAITGPSDNSGEAFSLNGGSSVFIDSNGGATFSIANYTTQFVEVNGGSQFELVGSGLSAFSGSVAKVDKSSRFFPGASGMVGMVAASCPPGLTALGQANQIFCGTAVGPVADWPAAFSACTAGTRMCTWDRIKLACGNGAPDATYWANHPEVGGNATIVACPGGTVGSAATNANTHSVLCCAD